MKKFLSLALCLLSVNAMAQSLLSRFYDPEAEKVVFQEKGSRTIGFAGSYRNISATGATESDGYAILSLLNIGTGNISIYNFSPKFSYFVGNDLALVFRLDYSGYTVNTDLRVDLRNMLNLSEIIDDPKDLKEVNDLLNLRISNRHMVNNTFGASAALRKYIPFFGSKTFAVFGEARLYGNYATTISCPIDENGRYVDASRRNNNAFSVGLKIAGGLCVRLRGNNALTVSVPLIGFAYNNTSQLQNETNNRARISEIKVARNLDLLGVQVGYCHFVGKKKK